MLLEKIPGVPTDIIQSQLKTRSGTHCKALPNSHQQCIYHVAEEGTTAMPSRIGICVSLPNSYGNITHRNTGYLFS